MDRDPRWVLLLLVAGAALATWGLSGRMRRRASSASLRRPRRRSLSAACRNRSPAQAPDAGSAAKVAEIEGRLRLVENATRRTAGAAGRADALLVAFASRRAIDRGVPLGYLETLLADRFGDQNPRAVAAIITASRDPVTLERLVADYEQLGPALRRGAPDEGLWQGFHREMGSLIAVRRASSPSGKPQARYERALAQLHNGHVDAALAETMRLPGAARASDWVTRARRYVVAHRALDEVESAALLAGGARIRVRRSSEIDSSQ